MAGSTGNRLSTSPGKGLAEGPWPPLDPWKERPLSHREPADSQRRHCGPPAEEDFPVDTTIMQQLPEHLCELKRDQHGPHRHLLRGSRVHRLPLPFLLALWLEPAPPRRFCLDLHSRPWEGVLRALGAVECKGGPFLFPLMSVSLAGPPVQPALHRSPACPSFPFPPMEIVFLSHPVLAQTQTNQYQ